MIRDVNENKHKHISFFILILIFFENVILKKELSFLLNITILLYLVFENDTRISMPKTKWFVVFIFFLVISFFIGLLSYDFFLVARDCLYLFNFIFIILIGANCKEVLERKNISVYKTLCTYSFIVSLYCFITFFLNGDFSFVGIRVMFVIGIYEISFILPIMIYKSYFKFEYAFSKKIDYTIITLLILHTFLSLGRISIFTPLLLSLATLFLAFRNKKSKNNFKKVIVILLLGIFGLVFVVFLIPEDVSEFFFDKILNSFNEINTAQVINSTESAMNNWRGFEMQSAKQQFNDYSIFLKIFGGGIGKNVHISYIPYSWIDMVENNQIPILHNGFYTILIKTGFLGLISFLMMQLQLIARGIRQINIPTLFEKSLYLIILGVGGLIYTYVVRGPLEPNNFIVWSFLVGYLNSHKNKM